MDMLRAIDFKWHVDDWLLLYPVALGVHFLKELAHCFGFQWQPLKNASLN